MMGFINDEDVPLGGQGLLNSLLIPCEQAHAAQYELTVEEWILSGIGGFDGLASFLVEDVEPEIETSQQFHEPLVNQRFRHEDQHPLRAAGQDQPMKNQACLDRFSQAH